MGVITSYDWDVTGKQLAVTFNTPQTPGDIFIGIYIYSQ